MYFCIRCVLVMCGIIAGGVIEIRAAGDGSHTVTLNEAECGILPENVTSADDIQPNHLPWVVRLAYKQKNQTNIYRCAGVLVSRRLVLTSATCVIPFEPTGVRIQSCPLDTNTSCTEEATATFGVSGVEPHPAFDPIDPRQVNNIALVVLDRAVPQHNEGGSSSICLPPNSFTSESLLDSHLFVAGWNIHEKGTEMHQNSQASRILNVTSVPVLANSECQQRFKNMSVIIQMSHLCAGGQGREPCSGDSGAPLQMLQGYPPRATAVGLVTFGHSRCGNVDFPTVYTNVGAFNQWIYNIIRKFS